jgi:hypothetical protein
MCLQSVAFDSSYSHEVTKVQAQSGEGQRGEGMCQLV